MLKPLAAQATAGAVAVVLWPAAVLLIPEPQVTFSAIWRDTRVALLVAVATAGALVLL
jgi:hypothetical protein